MLFNAYLLLATLLGASAAPTPAPTSLIEKRDGLDFAQNQDVIFFRLGKEIPRVVSDYVGKALDAYPQHNVLIYRQFENRFEFELDCDVIDERQFTLREKFWFAGPLGYYRLMIFNCAGTVWNHGTDPEKWLGYGGAFEMTHRGLVVEYSARD